MVQSNGNLGDRHVIILKESIKALPNYNHGINKIEQNQ